MYTVHPFHPGTKRHPNYSVFRQYRGLSISATYNIVGSGSACLNLHLYSVVMVVVGGGRGGEGGGRCSKLLLEVRQAVHSLCYLLLINRSWYMYEFCKVVRVRNFPGLL